MLVDVASLTLDFSRDPQADRGLYERAEHRRPDHRERDRHQNRFQLLEPERVTDDSGQATLRRDNSRQIWVYARRCKQPGEKRAQHPTDSVDAKSVECVIVVEQRL